MEYDPKCYYPGGWKDKRKQIYSWESITEAEINDYDLVAIKCEDNGFFVIDLDEVTDEAAAFITSTGLANTGTRKVRTQSGGFHWYFEADDIPRLIRPIPGIDILGTGMVFCPPSKDYELKEGNDILPPPQALLDAIAQLGSAQAEPQDSADYSTGSRNNDLFRFALAMRKKHSLDYADLLIFTRHKNQEMMDVPLSDAEVMQITASAVRYEPNEDEESTTDIPAERLGVSTYAARRLKVPPLESLIGPFTAGGVYIIAGPAGVAKSLWTQHMAHHIAGGTSFQGWDVPKKQRVLVVDGEMSLRLLHGRWPTMPDVEGVTHIYEDQFKDGDPFPQLGNPAWQEHFLDPMYTDYFGLMIFDTTSSLLAPAKGTTMVDAEYWQQVAKFNSRLRSSNTTVWWVDHTTGYKTTKVAGTYSKLNGIEAAIILEDTRDDIEQPPSFNVNVTKNRVMRPGAPPFRSHWHWGQAYKGWFREEYQEPAKQGGKK